MRILTLGGILCCDHQAGIVALAASQSLVTIQGVPVLVQGDPLGKGIAGCPNAGVTIVPCTATTAVTAGHSTLLRIDGRPVCLDTITGLTNGTPPGLVQFAVREPGQALVRSDA
jgi:uncharacterized Zn-binding protein involved in type VI secretion